MTTRNETSDTATVITFFATVILALFSRFQTSLWLGIAMPILAVVVALGLATGEGE